MAKATVTFYAKQGEARIGGEVPVLKEPPVASSEVDTASTAFSSAAAEDCYCRICADGAIYRRVGVGVTTANNTDPGMGAGTETFMIQKGHRVAIATKA